MPDYNFSESFLELAYRTVMLDNCKTEAEKRHFEVLCKVCDNFGISVKKYIEMLSAISELLKEFNDD